MPSILTTWTGIEVVEKHTSQPLTRIRWVRTLDALQYSLFVLGLFLLVPSFGRSWLKPMTPWYLVPAITLLGSVLLLPGRSGDPGLAAVLWRLRTSAALALGFSPFIYWYCNVGSNIYLLLGAFLAVLFFFWHLGEYAWLLEKAAVKADELRLEQRARLARQVLLYLGAVPLISLHVSFLIWPLVMPSYSPSDVSSLWFHTPLWIVGIMSLPPALFFLYIGAFRRRALHWPDPVWQQLN